MRCYYSIIALYFNTTFLRVKCVQGPQTYLFSASHHRSLHSLLYGFRHSDLIRVKNQTKPINNTGDPITSHFISLGFILLMPTEL